MFNLFHTLRTEGKVEPGLRTDVFLYADASAIRYVAEHVPDHNQGYVCAADASYVWDTNKDTWGFAGSFRVGLPHVFTTFWARADSSRKPR